MGLPAKKTWKQNYIKKGTTAKKYYRKEYVGKAVAARNIPIYRDRAAFYSTVVTETLTAFQSTGNVASYANLQLSFNSIPTQQMQAWQATFKQFRMKKIIVKIIPPSNQINVLQAAEPVFGTQTTAFNSRYYTAIDYVSATAPTSAQAIQQFDTCKSASVIKPMTRVVYPMINVPIVTVGGTGISGRTQMKASDTWFDLSDPAFTFGGLHWFCDVLTDGAQTTQPFTFQVQVEFHVDLRATW